MQNICFKALLLLVLFVLKATAQELIPPIQNNTSVKYKAASQNWGISLDSMGIVYAANSQGLVSYDGQRWHSYPSRNASIIRSIYAKGERIYTGSYEEFGFWKRNDKGQLEYTSLAPLLKNYELSSDEFWQILSLNQAIYFRSFAAVYKYNGKRIDQIKKVNCSSMAVYQGKLVVAISNKGLFYLSDEGELKALYNNSDFKKELVADMQTHGDELFIATKTNIYRFKDGRCSTIIGASLQQYLQKYELNHFLFIENDELVIGTLKNGIIRYNTTTAKIKTYTRNNGLQNNTVLAMAQSKRFLWLGLDNGIDRVELNAPIRFFTDETGELGAVYDLVFFNKELYVASNTGVYSWKNDKLNPVKGSEGHTWNLELLDNTLFANHNQGTFKIEQNTFQPVDNETGSFFIQDVPQQKRLKIIGSYTGLKIFSEKNKSLRKIDSLNFPIKKFIFESPTIVWAANPYEGIYRIVFSEDYSETRSITKIKGLNNSKNFNPEIAVINNQIAILNRGQWYKYNNFSEQLEVFKELNKYENHKLLLETPKGYWFVNNKNNSLVFTDFKGKDVIVSSRVLNNRLVKGHEDMIMKNDSVFYVSLIDGFARLNLNRLLRTQKNGKLNAPLISEFKDKYQYYPLKGTIEVPFTAAKQIAIKTATPAEKSGDLFYKLYHGGDTLQGKIQNGSLKFQNLDAGNYKLAVYVSKSEKMASKPGILDFKVMPPWFLSTSMKLVYFLIALILIGLILLYNRKKMIKHQLQLEQKFEKEHEQRLNEIEKERLRNEVDLKRKELANTTMMAAKKNEVLLEIQGELTKDQNKFSSDYKLKQILGKIKKTVKGKNEWEVFETNFNELHADFFKDLLTKYPKLTNKDLKLCAYLRMNLTSKEIAPLMVISVRGVEVHRYRLRKKMNMDSNENLTNFLIKNF